jgi:hypothetical protein
MYVCITKKPFKVSLINDYTENLYVIEIYFVFFHHIFFDIIQIFNGNFFYDIEIFCIIVNLLNSKQFFSGFQAKTRSFRPNRSYLLTFWKIIHFHWSQSILFILPCKFIKHGILRRVCGDDKHIRYFL